jgi:ATP-dependent DNA helicase DinG
MLPQAIIKLKQRVGRLIRTRQDRGLIVLLDPRVLTKRYGDAFLQALPDCRRWVDGVSDEASRCPGRSGARDTLDPESYPLYAALVNCLR